MSIFKFIIEKKVEVWYFVLWRNIEKFNDVKSIEDIVKLIVLLGFFNDFI